MKVAAEVYEQAAKRIADNSIELGMDVNGIDRNNFGLGMCHIMYARKIGLAFASKSAEVAGCIKNKDAIDDAARLVRESMNYIDPQRWYTLQFELGYSSMDVGVPNEAKKWLKQFTNTMERSRSLTVKQGATQHWSMIKARVDTRLGQLPWYETMVETNPGCLQDCEIFGDNGVSYATETPYENPGSFD